MWSFVWLAVAVVVALVLFLALREGILWYWKIDESIQLLREIRDELRIQNKGAINESVGSLMKFRSNGDQDRAEPR
ncbi:TPA: hypothetical protein QDA71_001272 [Burkholderia vietnamiensis]|nr:hypothetical protein [Burkholderia vietnamiensis]HDR9210608.1 hypothetical protein [Burkholderia vietnamiensis]